MEFLMLMPLLQLEDLLNIITHFVAANKIRSTEKKTTFLL